MPTAIDTTISFYHILNVASVTSLLQGGKVWRYNRPLNSDRIDVVISTPEYIGGSFNLTDVAINIHAPNLIQQPYGHEDNTHPDVANLKMVTDQVVALLSGYEFKVKGKVLRDADGHWFSNIIIELKEIDENEGVQASLIEMGSVPDGYGGFYPDRNIAWTGIAAKTDIKKGNQVQKDAGLYAFNLQTDWLVPVVPQKNWQISTEEGGEQVLYTIHGIIPEGTGLWRLNTYRKDAPYGNSN